MKYRSVERVIKEVAGGVGKPGTRLSLEHSIRNIMEARGYHDVETDPNDQIIAGTYRTKNFEQSSEAQKLYSSLPRNTDPDAVEQSAILHDKLFGIHKKAAATKRSTDTDVKTSTELVDKIMAIAKDLKLEKEHAYLGRVLKDINTHFDDTGNVVDAKDLDVEKITNRFRSPSKDITKEKQDNDIDNSKFVISRNMKAQRKIKLIDTD